MRNLFLIGFIFFSYLGLSQDKKIDQLEILYDQGYYNKVLRKASALVANPEYDYSGLPSYYKSLALFRMSNDEVWFKRHNYAITEAIASYEIFTTSDKIADYIYAHYYEISSLKTYLVDLETKFKGLRLNGTADELQAFRLNYLKNIKARPDVVIPTDKNPKKDDKREEIAENDVANTNNGSSTKDRSFREKLVVYAKSLVGVKYRWAGSDPDGFDCSGFVGYVHKKYGIVIPRTASDQMTGSKKVKLKDAFSGDLLFFSSGSNISHVGLVVNHKGENLMMVHASTSKGVIVTEIERSTYWKPKLKAAGTFISA